MEKKRVIYTVVYFLIGIYLLLVSFKILPINSEKVNTPPLITFIVGLCIIFSGLAIFTKKNGMYSLIFTGIAISSLAIAFIWVTIFGNTEAFSGGIWFLPKKFNILLARTAFGLFSIFFTIISYLIWKSVANNDRKIKQKSHI